MLCSPPPATTLASSCAGSEGFCAPCCRRSSQRSRIHNRPKTGRTLLLHERPNNIPAAVIRYFVLLFTLSSLLVVFLSRHVVRDICRVLEDAELWSFS